MKALIFSGGRFCGLPDEFDISEYELVICADSGYYAAQESGIVPDIFVGDFDSVLREEITAKKVIKLNPVKDMTDTQEAVDLAIDKGAKEIVLLGALGNRIDHTIANIHLLKYAHKKGVVLKIIDTDTSISLVTHKTDVKAKCGYCLSLLPLTDCLGVTVTGVYYPLNNASMPVGNPYGISNEFVDDYAHIEVAEGELLLMLCKS